MLQFHTRLFVCFFTWSSLAHASPHGDLPRMDDGCREVYEQLYDMGVRKTGDDLDDAVSRNEETVVFVKSESHPEGGAILHFKLVGDYWGSAYRTLAYNPQGDPRWAIDGLGVEICRYLGVEWDGRDLFQAGNGTYINRRIAELNTPGRQLVDLRFYDDVLSFLKTSGVAIPRGKLSQYLVAYSKLGALPLTQTIHDISFHLTAILFPAEILNQSRGHVRLTLGFLEYLKKNYRTFGLTGKQRLSFHRSLILNQALSIDIGTAYVTTAFVKYLAAKENYGIDLPMSDHFEPAFRYLVGSRHGSRVDYVKELIREIPLETKLSEEDREIIRTISMTKVWDAFEVYIANLDAKEYEPYSRLVRDRDELCKEIVQNRLQVAERVAQLNRRTD